MPGVFTFATFKAVNRPTRCAMSALPSYPQLYPHSCAHLPTFWGDHSRTRARIKRLNCGYFSGGWETAANKGEHRYGGESGIRTHGTVSRTHAFQACALSHSAIS